MKKTLLLIALCIAIFSQVRAQNVPNGGMEDWEPNGDGGIEPVFWETLNDDDLTTVFQVDGYEGLFAAKLSVEWNETLQMYTGPMFFLDHNFSISERFTALSFFLQGTAAETDYLSVNVGMFKNGVLIGGAFNQINETYDSWTEISMAIDYTNDGIPDSAYVAIQIYPIMDAHYGTNYTIDELNLNMGSGSYNPELLVAYTNVEGTAFELGFSMPMADPAGAHNQFSGKRNGNTIGFTSASLKPGDDYVIVLTLADPVLASDDLKVSYTAGTVIAATGEPLESFTDHAVLNQVGATLPSWQVIPSGVTEDLYSVHFANNTNGFIGGAMTKCLKSTNEGLSWSTVPVASGADFRAVWATSSNDAYLGAWDTVYATHNAGQNWTGAYTNTFVLGVMGLQFTSPNNGFAFLTYSSMTKTTDAGNSWSEPTGCGLIEDFYDGYMLDDNTGYGVGDCGLIAKTTDGGATFNLYDFGLDWSCIQIWGVHFTSALNGFATADSGVVFRTTDGGNHWNRSVIAGPEDLLNDVFFVNPATGYIVGNNGKIFKTTNGGDTWIQEPLLTTNNLHSVFFISENLGWIVGNNGTILRYGGPGPSGVDDPEGGLPDGLSLYPNPAANLLQFDLEIIEGGQYTLQLIDQTGRVVRQVMQSSLKPGSYKYNADVSKLPAGVYIGMLSNGKVNCSKKILVGR